MAFERGSLNIHITQGGLDKEFSYISAREQISQAAIQRGNKQGMKIKTTSREIYKDEVVYELLKLV